MHRISNKIKSRLDEMVATIKEWRKGTGPKKPITGSAEDITSKARAARTKTDADKKNETLDKKEVRDNDRKDLQQQEWIKKQQ